MTSAFSAKTLKQAYKSPRQARMPIHSDICILVPQLVALFGEIWGGQLWKSCLACGYHNNRKVTNTASVKEMQGCGGVLGSSSCNVTLGTLENKPLESKVQCVPSGPADQQLLPCRSVPREIRFCQKHSQAGRG